MERVVEAASGVAVLAHVYVGRAFGIVDAQDVRALGNVLGFHDADEVVVVQDEVVDKPGVACAAGPAVPPARVRAVPDLDESEVGGRGGDGRSARAGEVGGDEVDLAHVARGLHGE